MKKITKILPFLLVGILSACNNESSPLESSLDTTSTSSSEESSDPEPLTLAEKYKARRETSLIADTHFENGFYLISPESTNQYKE